MNQLIEILSGYSSPHVSHNGPCPIGETGLNVRVRYVALLEAAYRSLDRRQSFRLGQRHFYLTFSMTLESLRHLWQSEIMRVMDKARFGSKENLTIRLFHEKFQAEPRIKGADKLAEQKLYDLMDDRYRLDRYETFRNKAGFHIDKVEALKPPTQGGNLDWFRFAASVVVGGEPKYVTVGGPQEGKRIAIEFKEMMISTLRQRRR
jgi:hypothetical protein